MTTAAVRVPFVDLRAQDAPIRAEIETEIRRVIDEAAFVLGPAVGRFEQAFAAFLGVRHVVGVANGTDALYLALAGLGVGAGDEVIVPANTFVATAEAVVHTGARPVLVDADPRTCTIDPNAIRAALTPRVRAIMPVHLYGRAADLAPILEIADRHGLDVLEDAAQAQGAIYRDRRVGGWGRAAGFSFYPAKNLGAYGDAGAVVTNDDRVATTVRKLGNHGGLEKYRHDLPGHTSRLDSLQAAVLSVKLPHLDRWTRLRRETAERYDHLLADTPGIVTPAAAEAGAHVYHLYVIQVTRGSRDELQAYLATHGIETSIHYPQPLHLTPALSRLGYRRGAFPVAERLAESVLSLPMYPGLGAEQVDLVVERIREYMRAHA